MKYDEPANQLTAATHPPHRHHPSRHQHHVRPITAPLYVVTMISNPARYYSRYKLYQAFEEMVRDAGGILYTVEVAFRDRHFEITDPDNPRHIQLRSPSEIWLKESALNLAVSRLPASWEYVATVDADIQFARPDWVNETLQQLQHYSVVQMWSHATDLGPNFEPLHTTLGFAYQYANGKLPRTHRPNGEQHPYPYGAHGQAHPGYAWAYRRSAFHDLGGLGDIAILGSADQHMAMALIGRVDDSIHSQMHPSYREYWYEWQNRAERHIRRNVGHVPGTINHYWHGRKADRKYGARWRILVEEAYHWHLDIKRDPQGLWSLTERSYRLRDRIRAYFAQRNEDSVDL